MIKTLKIISLTLCLFFLIAALLPKRTSGRSKQATSKSNLKQMSANLVAYMGDQHGKKVIKFPPLGKAPTGESHVTEINTVLEGLPTHCPFYKLPYAYSKQKVGDYIIDEGQPIPPEILDWNKYPKESQLINIIVVKGAKAKGDEGAPKYAPLIPYTLRGDWSVGDDPNCKANRDE